MALSMDEQRILDEIERGLGNADPRLAARLSSFGFKRTMFTLRTRRARVVVSSLAIGRGYPIRRCRACWGRKAGL